MSGAFATSRGIQGNHGTARSRDSVDSVARSVDVAEAC